MNDLPPDLLRVLRDQGIVVPQDQAVWESISSWQNAPCNTASAGIACPHCGTPGGTGYTHACVRITTVNVQPISPSPRTSGSVVTKFGDDEQPAGWHGPASPHPDDKIPDEA